MSNTSSNFNMHKYCDEGGGGGASSKEMCTSCEQNKNVDSSGNNKSSTNSDAAVVGIDRITMSDTKLSVCANCGKEGSDMNICNRCNSVKYCNAACKKKHRSKHKKKCDRRVAELHDEKLFKQPPPEEDCPICMLRMPPLSTGYKYNSCCGKIICSGCIYAPVYDNQGNVVDNTKCPFCRTPAAYDEDEAIEKEKKRAEVNDTEAIFNLGCHYFDGTDGCPQNQDKGLELWHRAGKLGHSGSYYNIGCKYMSGEGVERDEEKAKHYWEKAAILGHIGARYNLGVSEYNKRHMDRALMHYTIAAGVGDGESLNKIKKLFMNGYATKVDYENALRARQTYLDEIRSVQRDQAAAISDDCRYY